MAVRLYQFAREFIALDQLRFRLGFFDGNRFGEGYQHLFELFQFHPIGRAKRSGHEHGHFIIHYRTERIAPVIIVFISIRATFGYTQHGFTADTVERMVISLVIVKYWRFGSQAMHFLQGRTGVERIHVNIRHGAGDGYGSQFFATGQHPFADIGQVFRKHHIG